MIGALVITLAIMLGDGRIGFISEPLGSLQECTAERAQQILTSTTLPDGATIKAVGYGCGEIPLKAVGEEPKPVPFPEKGA